VTVLWTVAHRDDPHDARAARAARLVRLADEAARQGAAPTVDHLASALGASRSTVRRTLADLRAEGIDVVTRGARD
jgi:biotin operon repressor